MANKKITDLQLRSSVTDDLNFPSDDTIQSYRVTGQQIYDYMRTRFYAPANEITNLTLTTAVGSSALTIALKTLAGTNPSSTDYIRVGFRNATLTTGNFSVKSITAATSLVISSGSTLGQASGQPSRIWVYLLDAGSSPELAVSSKKFSESDLVSTTAEGGAGAADSYNVMYSTTARTNVSCRLIGYIDNTQATAGTWASAGTQIQLLTSGGGSIVKPPTKTVLSSGSSTYYKPLGCTKLRYKMVGGGAGGAGTNTGGTGGTGGDTTFGVSTAAGGNGGTASGSAQGGTGGVATLGSGPVGIAIKGTDGCSAAATATTLNMLGGTGGASPFGGAARGGSPGGAPSAAAATNSGSGGGGGGGSSAGYSAGGGGGAGAYVEAEISDPVASYAYGVGAAGAAGTGTIQGSAGGSGVIIIEEFYT